MTLRPVLNSTKLRQNKKKEFNVLVDSGAYSAWRLNDTIDIDAYCDFLHQNMEWITYYVSLDVINPGDPDNAAADGIKNLKHMHRRRLNPIPVFHVFEDIKYLYQMLDLGCDYIGLSASSITSRGEVDRWYDYVWGLLVNSGGYPTVKVHCFGEGRHAPLIRYPWFSADSASWIYYSDITGSVVCPSKKRVFFRNDALTSKRTPDILTLGEQDLKEFNNYVLSLGVNPEVFTGRGIVTGTARLYVTACYFKWLQDEVRKVSPIKYKLGGLIDHSRKAETIDIKEFNLHLVSGGNVRAWIALALSGNPNILTSYHHIRSKNHYDHMRDYVFDPINTLRTNPIFSGHYRDLEGYLNASRIPYYQSKSVCQPVQQAGGVANL